MLCCERSVEGALAEVTCCAENVGNVRAGVPVGETVGVTVGPARCSCSVKSMEAKKLGTSWFASRPVMVTVANNVLGALRSCTLAVTFKTSDAPALNVSSPGVTCSQVLPLYDKFQVKS